MQHSKVNTPLWGEAYHKHWKSLIDLSGHWLSWKRSNRHLKLQLSKIVCSCFRKCNNRNMFFMNYWGSNFANSQKKASVKLHHWVPIGTNVDFSKVKNSTVVERLPCFLKTTKYSHFMIAWQCLLLRSFPSQPKPETFDTRHFSVPHCTKHAPVWQQGCRALLSSVPSKYSTDQGGFAQTRRLRLVHVAVKSSLSLCQGQGHRFPLLPP